MENNSVVGKMTEYQEIEAKHTNGMMMLLLNIVLIIGFLALFVVSAVRLEEGGGAGWVILIVVGSLYAFIVGPVLFAGLKVLGPNEAYVFTLFGKYYGTLKGAGFYFVNPFVTAVNPALKATSSGKIIPEQVLPTAKSQPMATDLSALTRRKVISLKAVTLNNDKQKVNDLLGNPVIIGIVVIWRVVNTAKAVFNVDNYTEFLSIQSDAALRNIVRLYPYDVSGDKDNEKSLRGSSQEVSDRLAMDILARVEVAGLEILEARITHLAYAPEIAAAMLQRQQASAIIDARQMIVEGAVGMVEMALSKLSENGIVELDEERKAAMVSNLLVVLCGNRDAQPVVNSGSLY
ncbi:MAG: SPFH domain-containing protein [Clostridiaceae bacterium]|nr:SPFH domain-containing protein [Clostridiaceae bacterium]